MQLYMQAAGSAASRRAHHPLRMTPGMPGDASVDRRGPQVRLASGGLALAP